MDSIFIGLPKGRFIDFSKKFVKNNLAGYSFKNAAPRSSDLISECNKIVVFFLKASDIPNLLNENKIDIAVAPSEWCLENNLSENIHLSCINPSLNAISISIKAFSNYMTWPKKSSITITTSFPNLTKIFFNKAKLDYLGYDSIEIVRASGSIESITKHICDIGVDCVETGQSIIDNKLNILETLYQNLDLSIWANEKGRLLLKNIGIK